MTRLELYHEKNKKVYPKGSLLFLIVCIFVLSGLLIYKFYYQNTIKIESPEESLGRKVVVHLKNGEEVFTYEKLIVKSNGKTYYKGERNTIDLTGGTISYKNWK